MFNNLPYGQHSHEMGPQNDQSWPCQHLSTTNRYIYVKQNITRKSSRNALNTSQKVLVNPHFKQSEPGKVFVNPNFSGATIAHKPSVIHVNPRMKSVKLPVLNESNVKSSQKVPLHSTKIHVNPNVKNVQIPLTTSQTVHINPNFRNMLSNTNILQDVFSTNTVLSSTSPNCVQEKFESNNLNEALVLTKTKIVMAPIGGQSKKIKRRNSVKSKFKIVKSTWKNGSKETNENIPGVVKNRFKIDNRRRKSLSLVAKNYKKYVYVNRFVSLSDLAKHAVMKKPSHLIKSANVINISGIMYKTSRNSLRRASVSSVSRRSPEKNVRKSKYKIVRKLAVRRQSFGKKVAVKSKGVGNRSFIVKKFQIVRKQLPKKMSTKSSAKKLKKCNIPCPHYKKYGLCKGKENGGCFRKHDPDQIALCTRFLQGACIKEKCLLSHQVLPEKMPTCKYYLEGSCSRENCPYLHVKISPKAEICRDFIEGFCRNAAECNRRHQYLCPDHEKYGNCAKQRCPYPHGKMVRNYLVNKSKFAKKCSDKKNTCKSLDGDRNVGLIDKNGENLVGKERQRYYAEEASDCDKNEGVEEKINKDFAKDLRGLRSRPKLGDLPLFIPFGES